MTSLGQFGKQRTATEATFGYFDAEIRVNPDLSDVAIVKMFAVLNEAATDPAKGAEALALLGATLVHPDDLERFWSLVAANRQTVEDLGDLAQGLIEALAQRPTKQPSDSSDGLPTTPTNSTDDSSTAALRLLDGRPDLQVAVVRAQAG